METSFEKYNPADSDLWSKFKEGDSEAFRLIYERHCDSLFKYGLSVVYDRALVQDAIHDLFIDLWRQRQKIAVAQSVKNYLFISLRRSVIQKSNAEKKKNIHLRFFNLTNKDNVVSSSDEILVQKETGLINKEIISIGLKGLAPRQREAIFLRFYENLEYEEIGRIMDINYQVVRNTIYRSIKSLRLKLHDKY